MTEFVVRFRITSHANTLAVLAPPLRSKAGSPRLPFSPRRNAIAFFAMSGRLNIFAQLQTAPVPAARPALTKAESCV
jgi:hypothetical protein